MPHKISRRQSPTLCIGLRGLLVKRFSAFKVCIGTRFGSPRLAPCVLCRANLRRSLRSAFWRLTSTQYSHQAQQQEEPS